MPALVGVAVAGELAGVLAGGAAMLGHWRPLFLGFEKGGKAVATAGGAFLGVAPLVGLVGLAFLDRHLPRHPVRVPRLDRDRARAAARLAVALGEPWPVVVFARARGGVIVLHRRTSARLLARHREPVPAAPGLSPGGCHGVRDVPGCLARRCAAWALPAADLRLRSAPVRSDARGGVVAVLAVLGLLAARSRPAAPWCGSVARPTCPAGGPDPGFYAFPSDGVDRAEAGAAIAADPERSRRGGSGRTPSRTPRFDQTTFPCGAQPDLGRSGCRERRASSELRRTFGAPRDAAETSAAAALTKFLVYYDGPADARLCGRGGGVAGGGPGVAIVFLAACPDVPLPRRPPTS